MRDRRTTQRMSVHLPARYDSDALAMSAWVCNLSTVGLFLRSDYLDHRGSVVNLAIALPQKISPVEACGKVVRVDERPAVGGMGIQFVDLALDDQQALSKFMIQKAYRAGVQG